MTNLLGNRRYSSKDGRVSQQICHLSPERQLVP
jgi:hypothetical protein